MHYSVERYFASVRDAMPADVSVRTRVEPVVSRRIGRRLRIVADVARQRGDVVHVTGDIHFAVLGLRRRRAILTVLDCGLATGGGVRAVVYRTLWLRWPARRSARLVAISNFTAGELARHAGVDRQRVDVIPVAVDDALVPFPAPTNPTPVVLCFATTPNKNFTATVDAVRGLDVHLDVIGPLTADDEQRLVRNGVAFDNAVGLSDADMRAHYERCDLVLFPSTYEGFGMPIVEAQAVGRPVVTSDRAPMNEVAGGAACLVDPDDAASIRAGVERVLSDGEYRDELVRKGFENRERFRPAVAAAAYAAIYRAMVSA